ncbi:hypothetical protein A5649_13445 [Mycolicibacter heraklionensis]|uniref:Uncharacterized protein n=1 Tax=Mycolicibacter heraklionensis TaxID=512402 RepID=A0AA91F2W8_9MYCO|nr:hypothetical protein [Mycolicibacter heraklionensis]OBK89451.1 hypothetical protein A5649_13445 [Mycolicibacter heraklionensis]
MRREQRERLAVRRAQQTVAEGLERVAVWVSVLAALFALLLSIVAVTGMSAGRTQWGDVPTWLAAIGTTAAVAVALRAASKEARTRKWLEHRQQADRVTAWVVNPRGPEATGGAFTAPPEWVALLNSSDAVVYDVVVTLRFKIRGADAPVAGHVFVRFLPPGESLTRVRGPLSDAGEEIAFDVVENASIAFTDTRGTHWRRNAAGSLTELSESALVEHGARDAISFNWLTGKFPDKPR